MKQMVRFFITMKQLMNGHSTTQKKIKKQLHYPQNYPIIIE